MDCIQCRAEIGDLDLAIVFENSVYDKVGICDKCQDRPEPDTLVKLSEAYTRAIKNKGKVEKLYGASVKSLVNANAEIKTLYDAAKQAMKATGQGGSL